MPFQSEKQRRYLWANEPEIARDWTDTYGSGIAKALGGRIGFRRGTSGAPGGGDPGMTSAPSGKGQTHSGGGGDKGPAHLSHNAPVFAPEAPPREVGGAGYISPADQRTLDIKQDIINRNLEKDYRDVRYMAHDFGNYGLQGQQKINEYQPTFGQRFKTGIGNLFSGLGGGLRNLAGFVNPLAFAIDNPYARLGINYMGKKFAPNFYNKWSNQDSGWTDPDEKEDVAWENINYNPNALTRLEQLGIMGPNINKYEYDKGPNTMTHDYLSLSKFSDEQKKKAEKELEWQVTPKDIMPKLQQLDETSWGMKTKNAIKAQEFIGWLETEKGMQLTEDQKREIYEAAGQEMEDPI